MQRTLSNSVSCTGVGLHTGKMMTLVLHPAEVDHGVVFKRTDVSGDNGVIPASYLNVSDTRLCSVIENVHGVRIGTVEHLMAALWGMGVDNAMIEVDGPEVPIMDGSSEPFLFLIECAGVEEQSAPRRYMQINRTVVVEEGDSVAIIEPFDGFAIDVEIAFAHDAIGKQRALYDFSSTSFKQSLCRARTFGFETEVAQMRAAGLALGGSLHNAVVVGDEGVLNNDGLRYNDEFVRHKALDCVGDYFLAGHRILGKVTTRKPGHALNNKVIKALYANRDAWQLVTRYSDTMAETPTAPTRIPSAGTAVVAGAVMKNVE